jgi:hypothetical protein
MLVKVLKASEDTYLRYFITFVYTFYYIRIHEAISTFGIHMISPHPLPRLHLLLHLKSRQG